ncbi:unnamed protein product, partial [Phaeothamnion confervicola]
MDKNVERYVVVKGLINTMDAAAAANAVKEKRFLSELRDPHIVDIVNFVNHEGGQYIVMEFVNGVTLKDIRKERGPLPVEQAVAYTLAMLPAFEFLHERKVIYCDFKIENAMVQKDRVRLIDLGGARRIDDLDSDLYLTRGYAAPEAEQAPSVASDLYTVGRTLAVLMMDFDFRKTHRYSLPTPQEVTKFAEYESLYRFLLRATAKESVDRFQSAAEMASQLEGVLREIVALESGRPRPTESLYFGLDIRCESAAAGLDSLPSMRIDPKDPARALIESALVLNDPHTQKTLFENALVRFPSSTEASLRLADSCIGLKQFGEAEKILAGLSDEDAYDWRIFWLRGRLKIAQGDAKGSLPLLDAVFSELPGELAPKLALAVASELSGDLENAIRLYDLVSRVDPGYITAAFGLARCLRARKDRHAAVSAYARVATTS